MAVLTTGRDYSAARDGHTLRRKASIRLERRIVCRLWQTENFVKADMMPARFGEVQTPATKELALAGES
jgi:hypothetical protein